MPNISTVATVALSTAVQPGVAMNLPIVYWQPVRAVAVWIDKALDRVENLGPSGDELDRLVDSFPAPAEWYEE